MNTHNATTMNSGYDSDTPREEYVRENWDDSDNADDYDYESDNSDDYDNNYAKADMAEKMMKPVITVLHPIAIQRLTNTQTIDKTTPIVHDTTKETDAELAKIKDMMKWNEQEAELEVVAHPPPTKMTKDQKKEFPSMGASVHSFSPPKHQPKWKQPSDKCLETFALGVESYNAKRNAYKNSNTHSRSAAFEKLGDKSHPSRKCTEVCRSVSKGVKCPHGEEKCNFAHTKEQLVLPNCFFNEGCHFINRPKRDGSVCQFFHVEQDMDVDGYYKRTGKTPPVFAIAPVEIVLPTMSKAYAAKMEASKMEADRVAYSTKMEADRMAHAAKPNAWLKNKAFKTPTPPTTPHPQLKTRWAPAVAVKEIEPELAQTKPPVVFKMKTFDASVCEAILATGLGNVRFEFG
jgi:hypothetical protein